MQSGNYHLIIVLIFFAFSALSWVVGKLREQAAIKRARDEARRARDEELRTGRLVQAPQPTRGGELAELRELAMKRQQQLAQMREMQRRTASGGRGRPPEQVVFGPAQVPMPGTPTMRGPGPVMRGPGVPGVPGVPGRPGVPAGVRQKDRPSMRPQPLPERGVQDIRPGVPQPKFRGRPGAARRDEAPPQLEQPAFTIERGPTRRLVVDSVDPVHPEQDEGRVRRPAPVGLAALLGTGTARPGVAEMRRAIILNEVFSKPVGMRTVSET